jgi:hypothetical protein
MYFEMEDESKIVKKRKNEVQWNDFFEIMSIKKHKAHLKLQDTKKADQWKAIV